MNLKLFFILSLVPWSGVYCLNDTPAKFASGNFTSCSKDSIIFYFGSYFDSTDSGFSKLRNVSVVSVTREGKTLWHLKLGSPNLEEYPVSISQFNDTLFILYEEGSIIYQKKSVLVTANLKGEVLAQHIFPLEPSGLLICDNIAYLYGTSNVGVNSLDKVNSYGVVMELDRNMKIKWQRFYRKSRIGKSIIGLRRLKSGQLCFINFFESEDGKNKFDFVQANMDGAVLSAKTFSTDFPITFESWKNSKCNDFYFLKRGRNDGKETFYVGLFNFQTGRHEMVNAYESNGTKFYYSLVKLNDILALAISDIDQSTCTLLKINLNLKKTATVTTKLADSNSLFTAIHLTNNSDGQTLLSALSFKKGVFSLNGNIKMLGVYKF